MNLAPLQPSGRAVTCPVWLLGIRSPSPQSIACVHSQRETKPKTTPAKALSFLGKVWDYPPRGALAGEVGAAEGPSPSAGTVRPLCAGVPGALARLPCAARAGWWDFAECKLCCALREGSLPCSLLQDCFSVLCVLLNWRKKSAVFRFK